MGSFCEGSVQLGTCRRLRQNWNRLFSRDLVGIRIISRILTITTPQNYILKFLKFGKGASTSNMPYDRGKLTSRAKLEGLETALTGAEGGVG